MKNVSDPTLIYQVNHSSRSAVICCLFNLGWFSLWSLALVVPPEPEEGGRSGTSTRASDTTNSDPAGHAEVTTGGIVIIIIIMVLEAMIVKMTMMMILMKMIKTSQRQRVAWCIWSVTIGHLLRNVGADN